MLPLRAVRHAAASLVLMYRSTRFFRIGVDLYPESVGLAGRTRVFIRGAHVGPRGRRGLVGQLHSASGGQVTVTPELQQLEQQLQQGQQAKWWSYDRRSIGMTDEEKIVLAREILASPGFGMFQCWAESIQYKQRHPTKTELEVLIEQLQQDHVRWLCYRRRSLGVKTESDKIELAKQVLAMPPFGRARIKWEHWWAEQHPDG